MEGDILHAPEGQNRWTVRLLADKAVELCFAESVSHMTVQRPRSIETFDPQEARRLTEQLETHNRFIHN